MTTAPKIPSTCAGCRFAEWNRTASGTLHPNGSGYCRHPIVVALEAQAEEQIRAGTAKDRQGFRAGVRYTLPMPLPMTVPVSVCVQHNIQRRLVGPFTVNRECPTREAAE
jgi:hypothetical protein